MNVIIVGIGKAAILHYNAYKKLNKDIKIFFVDVNKEKKFKDFVVYPSIESIIKNNELKGRIIVDICTPTTQFFNVINQVKKLNLNNIIVEKPFIVEKNFFEKNPELNIVMVQNYLYSKIYIDAKKKINKEKRDIKMIFSNFSKNRIQESIKGRGMEGKITENILVEMPHQIYLVKNLFENKKNLNIISVEQHDMNYEECQLKNHGFSRIIFKIDDIIAINESDLASNTVQKTLKIVLNDDNMLELNFPIYTSNLEKIKCGSLIEYKNGEEIYIKEYSYDDMMTYFFDEVINYFEKGIKEDKYLKRINEFSKIYRKLGIKSL